MNAEQTLRSLEADASLIPDRFQGWWKNYLHRHHHYYLDVLSFLNEQDKQGKILEVGSVPGHFTVLLKLLGYDVLGVDIDPKRVAPLWQKYDLTVEKVDIEQQPLPFPANSFSVVLFSEILEHLRMNPLYALKELHRVLAPGGRLILGTPNITVLHRFHFLLGKGYQGNPVEEFKKLDSLGHMGHIRLYTLDEVESFLKHTGFQVASHAYKGPIKTESMSEKLIALLAPKKERLRNFLHVIARKDGAYTTSPAH